MDNIVGTAGDDTINALVTNPTTGADATTIQSLDVINGGAGKDTLNITSTADYNKSLAGLTVTGVEVINVTGANNLAVTSSSTASAVAGSAQVVVYDLTAARPTSEIQTINFGDLTVSTAGAITVGGVSVSLAVGDTGKVLADKVVAALTADSTFNANVSSYSVTGGVVTVNFKTSVTSATLLDPATLTVAAPGSGAAAYSSTAAVTSAAGVVVSTTQAASLTSAIRVTVNGTDYSANVTTLANQLSTTQATKDTADATVLQNTRDAVKTVLTAVLGGTVTVGNGDNLNEVTLTSKNVGQSLPSVSVAQGSASLSVVDSADPFTVANVEKTGAEGALSQILSIAIDDGTTADFVAGNKFQLYVNGASQGAYDIAAAATEADVAAQVAAAINSVLGAGVASAVGSTVRVTAPVAGTALPHMNIVMTSADNASATFSQIRANQDPLGTATSTVAASIAASGWTDATEVWLLGASGSASVSAASGQTIGFNGVSSMANTVTFAGTNAALASVGSSGSLTIKGSSLVSASLSGTTAGSSTTPLSLTDGNTIASIKALNVSTTGATELNTTGMTALTSITQTGAGALTVNRSIAAGTNADKLATVTTGAGADQVRIATATAADIVSTTLDETVNASVSTGAGNDRVIVNTSGAGKTTVDLGDGNDTLFLTTISTGANSLSGGAGNDVFRVGTIAGLSTTTINGGADTDTLRTTTNGTLALVDYTTLSANVSSIETIQFDSGSNAVTLDASKIAMSRIEFLGSGTNTVTEVSSSQELAALRSAAVSSTGVSFGIGASEAVVPTNITANSKGYLRDGNTTLSGNQTVAGDNLKVTMTHVASNATLVARGAALDLSVTALAAATSSAGTIAEVASGVTLTGDVQSAKVTLTSARGTNTAGTTTSLGSETMAAFSLTVAAEDTNAATALTNHNLQNITISGAGVVTIVAGSIAALDAKLTSINLSGMTAFANQNALGQEIGAGANNSGTVGGYENLSTSSITLNTNVAETVTLGGAKDTVVTASSTSKIDTITGFQLVASAADPLVADAARSDVLDLGTAGGAAFSTANAVKMVPTGSTLEAAILQASNAKNADGTADRENVVFLFGGDTYVYQDVGGNGLDTSDILVRLTGTYNLDLLLTSGVIIG